MTDSDLVLVHEAVEAGKSSLAPEERRRKLSAFVGVPFGGSLLAFACGAILGWPFPMRFFALAIPVGAILGVVLMVPLLTGFLSHAFARHGSEWED
jgi:hypothetical protein